MKSVLTMSVVMFLLLSGTPGHARQADKNNPLHAYNTMLSQFWGQLYARGGATLYCDKKFGRRKGSLINAEHVFTMSWVARSLQCGSRSQCANAVGTIRVSDQLKPTCITSGRRARM